MNCELNNSDFIPYLDKGFARLVSHLGDDLTVVNSARVSYGKSKDTFDDSDRKLLSYLIKNNHWSPFRHTQVQFHCKIPEAIARQLYKHCIGMSYTEGREADHAWNEISGRYIDFSNIDFYLPEKCRVQSSSSKQASKEADDWIVIKDESYSDLNGYSRTYSDDGYGNATPDKYTVYAEDLMANVYDVCLSAYKTLIEAGVAKEQARLVLPVSFYTEFYWTASLQAIINFVKLRNHEHAQYEIQVFAKTILGLVREVYPETISAMEELNYI